MKRKKSKGFTLAETLIVVAIIVILMAVAFVGVARYRRSMRQVEFDSFAKEIFIAVQNHLTMADSQGLLSEKSCGRQTDSEKANDIWYFVYPTTDYNKDNPSVLDLMLPFGAVDETVRIGGSYIIRYQRSSARVLDVFFSSAADQSGLLKNLGRELVNADYDELMKDTYHGDSAAQKRARQRYAGNYVVGWYGGDDLPEAKSKLKPPSIQIINNDKLEVRVTNPNLGATDYAENKIESMKLYVAGKTSGAKLMLPLSLRDQAQNGYSYDLTGTISVVLDDITTDGSHFAQLCCGTAAQPFPSLLSFFEGQSVYFIPGEDLEIWAEAEPDSVMGNIARSAKLTANSLFADLENSNSSADIAYIRHLENLDDRISGFDPEKLLGIGNTAFSAEQILDMDWEDFRDYTENRALTFVKTGETVIAADSFYPVDPSYTLSAYSGRPESETEFPGHSISSVKIDTNGSAGLFARIAADCSVSNLELIDFAVKTSGTGMSAGALAGEAVSAKLSNVLARHDRQDDGLDKTVNAVSGSAGGLIGTADAAPGKSGCEITDCAAALYVSAGGSAGGLIGTSSQAVLKNSYSGGHTYSNGTSAIAEYRATDDPTAVGHWNAIGTTAGGLIGTSSDDSLTGCYSTCSASGFGAAAGGLIGSASGTSATDCYVTGLVSMNGHAVVGTGAVTGSGNLYYGIVNQLPTDNTDADQTMAPGNIPCVSVSGSSTDSLEDRIALYNSFFSGTAKAFPYDSGLTAICRGRYPMPASGADSGSFAAAHYGDWPMPDTRAINQVG